MNTTWTQYQDSLTDEDRRRLAASEVAAWLRDGVIDQEAADEFMRVIEI